MLTKKKDFNQAKEKLNKSKKLFQNIGTKRYLNIIEKELENIKKML